ncbi:MAG: hypothetical protein RLZ57_831, partial [Actinomycetota bacterium]
MRKKLVTIFVVLGLVAVATFINTNSDNSQGKVISNVVPSNGVSIDTSLYIPKSTPAPVILLAHGFGGNKDSVRATAQLFQRNGFAVLTWSARGFGNSTGQITMNAPDKEVADASNLIDYIQNRKEIKKDQSGKAIVGAMGGSYGGALSLMLAAQDKRVKAVSADITWNNLQEALFPQNGINLKNVGPFKKTWAGTFFSFTALQNSYLGQCGNFADAWCQAFQDAVTVGTPTAAQIELMKKSSPATYLSKLSAPTLLMQGQEDSLFPLIESERNAQAILKANPATPLTLIWHSGGHDGGNSESERLNQLSLQWFNKYLLNKNIEIPKFEVTDTSGTLSVTDSTVVSTVLQNNKLPIEANLSSIT